MTLYHFTSRWVLPRIMREGIVRGDVPIDPGDTGKPEGGLGFNAPWFTGAPEWDEQKEWTAFSILDKQEVRLTVEVEESDPNLLSWAQIAEKYRIPAYWQEALRTNPRKHVDWFIYLGGVHPSKIKKVDVRDGLKPLSSLDLPPEFFYYNNDRNSPERPGPARKTHRTRTEFINRSGNWVRSPYMKFPWSDMPTPLLRVLADSSPEVASQHGRAFCEKSGINLTLQSPDQIYPAMITMDGVSRWLHSSRKIIQVSKLSYDLLEAWEERFFGLPFVQEKPWRHGLMLHFEGDILVYVEPMTGDKPGITFAVWSRQVTGIWGTVSAKDREREQWMSCDTYTDFNRLLDARSKLAVQEDGTRLDLGKLRRVSINALAAINENPKVILAGKRKAPRKRGKEGGISRVRRMTLDFDAARLVTKRWVILPTPPATEKIHHKDHKSPVLHDVEEHKWRVWVNTPKAHEKVLETRERKDKKGRTYHQYRVARLRGKGGFARGGRGEDPVGAESVRLVVGVEDLNMPGDKP